MLQILLVKPAISYSLNEQLTGLEVLENITEQLNRQLDANLKHTVGINSFLMGLGLIDIVSP